MNLKVGALTSSTSALRLRLGETPRQTGLLFSAHTGSMAAGLLASVIQARVMEPAEMGRFAFCLSIVVIVSLLVELGVFPAGARVLALAENGEAERSALGALVLISLAIGATLSLVVAAAALPIDLIFKKDVRWLLWATSAFAFFQPFQLLVEQSCQGLNRIRRLSMFHLMMSGAYLLMLIALAAANRLSAATALAAYLTAIGAAALVVLALLRPRFRDTARYVKLTLKEARRYGLNIYLARITGTVSTQFDNLVITYFVGLEPLGLYAIAQKLASPIVTLSRALAVTRFRAFSRLDRVPVRITRWNLAALIFLSAGLVLIGPVALRLAFPKYAPAAFLLVPLAAYSLFAGMFQPYNMFLASHGRGAEIRNIAITVTAATFAGLLLLVPRFGIAGAAWAGAAAMVLDYLLHLYYYRRFRQRLKAASDGADSTTQLDGAEDGHSKQR